MAFFDSYVYCTAGMILKILLGYWLVNEGLRNWETRVTKGVGFVKEGVGEDSRRDPSTLSGLAHRTEALAFRDGKLGSMQGGLKADLARSQSFPGPVWDETNQLNVTFFRVGFTPLKLTPSLTKRCADLLKFGVRVTCQRFVSRRLVDGTVTSTNRGSLVGDCAVLVSSLSYFGHQSLEGVEKGVQAAAAELDLSQLQRVEPEQCGLQSLDQAIAKLSQLSNPLRRKLLRACAACVSNNGEVIAEEAEILRAVAASFDCPMPPLLPGQKVV